VIVFPLVAATVSAVFAAMLLRQYTKGHRIPQLAWGVAMTLFALASLIVAYGTTQTWDATMYKLFWLFGVMLNVPWLAVGSIALLGNQFVARAALVAVLLASAWGLVSTFATRTCPATVNSGNTVQCAPGAQQFGAHTFDEKNIPRAKAVWATTVPGQRRGVYGLGVLFSTVAYVIVIGIAVWTSRKRKGVEPPKERRRSNLMIATGVTIVAVGSTALSRLAKGSLFSVSLAAGVTVMFAGFLQALRAPRAPQA
jgi:hypothetical protein